MASQSHSHLRLDQRRVSKQVMERQRRARINASLDQLKELLRVSQQVEPSRLQRLEKADILELTVALLQRGRRRLQGDADSRKPGAMTSEAEAMGSQEDSRSSGSSSSEQSAGFGGPGDCQHGAELRPQQRLGKRAPQGQYRLPLAAVENRPKATAESAIVWRPW